MRINRRIKKREKREADVRCSMVGVAAACHRLLWPISGCLANRLAPNPALITFFGPLGWDTW